MKVEGLEKGGTCTAKVPTPPDAAVIRRFFVSLDLPSMSMPAEFRTLWRAANPEIPMAEPRTAVTSCRLLIVVLVEAIAYSARPPPACSKSPKMTYFL
jgi:hypothetical protein